MITKIKNTDAKKLTTEDGLCETGLYYVLDQAADKIRAIYVLFGWAHMTKDMHEVDDTLNNLVISCAKSLADKPKQSDARTSSAGISVDMYRGEEGFICVEVGFNIIH